MINAVLIDAYRSIKGPARIDFSNITLLCGPNSAGKSSLIRVLDFFKLLSSEEPWTADKSGGPIRTLETGKNYEDQIKIGIEFTVPSSAQIENRKRFNDYTNKYISANWDHQYIWEEFSGKKMKIMVQCGGNHPERSDVFELFIEDKKILSIDDDSTFFNHFFETENVNEAFYDRSGIFGNIKIHDSLDSIYISLDDEKAKLKNRSLSNLFRSKSNEWTTIRGIGFTYLSSESKFLYSISPNNAITDLFDDNEELIKWATEASLNSYSDETVKEEEYKKWLDDNKIKNISSNLEKIYDSLWDEASKLECFMEGIFIHLEAALNYEHVSGSRSLIESEKPYHLAYHDGKAGKLENRSQDEHVDRYLASWWWNHLRKNKLDLFQISESDNVDMVQHGYSKLMPSLGGYSFAPQVFELKDITRHNNAQITSNSTSSFESISSGVIVYPYLNTLANPAHLLKFNEVGSGLSFMLPIFSCLNTSQISIVEQPELHLHPRAQCELGDVFIFAAHHSHFSVVETHSEHLILRLSRRIRETYKGLLIKNELKLNPSDVSIHYFKPNGDGTTSIHKIRFDSTGEFLDLWPDGFFAERDSELFDE